MGQVMHQKQMKTRLDCDIQNTNQASKAVAKQPKKHKNVEEFEGLLD